MSEKWIQVSPEQAKQHRLYGIKGWLLVFMIGVVLSIVLPPLMVAGSLASHNISWSTFQKFDPNTAKFLKFLIGYVVIISGLIVWLAFEKAKEFRSFSIYALLSVFPVNVLLVALFQVAGSASFLGEDLIRWVISCAIWISYLNLSKRVRVTFESKVHYKEASNEAHTSEGSINKQYQRSVIAKHDVLSNSPSQSISIHSQVADAASDLLMPIAMRKENLGVESKDFTAQRSDRSDSEVWGLVLDEYEGGARDRSLYARLFAEYDGDEQKTKAAYLKTRVSEIGQEHAQRRAAEQLQAKRNLENALRETILKRSWGTLNEDGVEFLSFLNSYFGFIVRNRCYVFDDRGVMISQYRQAVGDISWVISGHIFDYQLEEHDNATCLAEGKYSKEWSGGQMYYQFFNGNVACISMGRIYVFDRLDKLLSAVAKGNAAKLCLEIYDLDNKLVSKGGRSE